MMSGWRFTCRVHRCNHASLASGQDGFVCFDQAIDLGLTPGQVEWRMRSGEWTGHYRTVYRVAGSPLTDRGRLVAIALAGSDRVTFSHRCAARLHGFDGFEDAEPEVICPLGRRLRGVDAIVHEAEVGSHFRMLDGLRVTSTHRTIVDLAAVADQRTLEIALDSALSKRAVHLGGLEDMMSELGRRRGYVQLRDAIEARKPLTSALASVLETDVFRGLRRCHLPMPSVQHVVRTGEKVARIDFAWADLGVLVEVDGRAYHRGLVAEARDQDRQNRLVIGGMLVVRFPWIKVRREMPAVIVDIEAALRARGWKPGLR